jgi:hypothetical protein
MERQPIAGLTLYSDPRERDTADLIATASRKTLLILQEHWGFAPPDDCRVYVMTSWLRFMFHSAPWSWRIVMAVTLPFWSRRAREMWPLAGGFHQAYGRRRAIGVKPPRLIRRADGALGEQIFVPEENADLERKVQYITCHELTHACAAHLKPPMWLNEGLAMVTVDLYAGSQTVRQETLDLLVQPRAGGEPADYRDVRASDSESLLYDTVRGYWLVRYLHDRYPGVLRQLLARRYESGEMTNVMATAVGLREADFWPDIDAMVVDLFERNPNRQGSWRRSGSVEAT